MAKKAGPKEAQLRALREHGTSGSNGDEFASLFESVEAAKQKAADKIREKIAALEQEKKELTASIDAQLDEAHRYLDKLLGGTSRTIRSGTGGGTGRTRRSEDQCKADAEKIVAHLRSNPGSAGGDIRKVADFGISLPKFLDKYAPGTKLEKQGDKASTTWSIKK